MSTDITRQLIVMAETILREGNANLAKSRELLSLADARMKSILASNSDALRGLDVATQLLGPETERSGL